MFVGVWRSAFSLFAFKNQLVGQPAAATPQLAHEREMELRGEGGLVSFEANIPFGAKLSQARPVGPNS